MEYMHGSHTRYDIKYHVVWVTNVGMVKNGL
jgi:REP element-mobilizing transposase RayT